MENMIEIEAEETLVTEINELETHIVKNVSERQDQSVDNGDDVREEERLVSKLNMKQQIDLKVLIYEETKQYIFMEEKMKMSKTSIDQQMKKAQENIQKLKQKIHNQKEKQHREESEADNELHKQIELKTLTQSTKEIVGVLKSYVESLEQQISKLKFSHLEKKVLKKYEESSIMINENFDKINAIKMEIASIKSNCKGDKRDFEKEMEVKMNNKKNEMTRLKNEMNITSKENQLMEDEISNIDDEIKKTRELQNFDKIKEIWDVNMKHIEEYKTVTSKLQKMESERDGLLQSIQSSSALLSSLAEYNEELMKNISSLEFELQELQNKNGDDLEDNVEFDEGELAELKQEELRLEQELKEVEKLIFTSKRKTERLDEKNHEQKIMLLNQKNETERLREQLSKNQKLYGDQKKQVAKLKEEDAALEEELQEKRLVSEELEKEQISLEKTNKELKISLQTHENDISQKTERLNYEKNTTQEHLEGKLKGLKEELAILEEKKEQEKKRFLEIDAVNKRKTNQHKRLRNIYATLTFKSPQKVEEKKHKDTEENKEIIEGERNPTETSPKGILKSPNTSRANTPTKNVKFAGLSSIPSSNSSEMIGTEHKQDRYAFD